MSAIATPGLSGTMALPGQVSVGPSGAASYAIPIPVPPGTAGVAPSLSLHYTSQGDNGLLGIGWSLAGLSSVTRCAKTFAQDGVRGGINYDANDRFCLDGQRLVAISGTYGADGTEYRTETDGYSKIVSYGTQGNGPAWFEVRTKAGQAMQFGWTADSRIIAQGKTTAGTWALSKLSDAKGNNFTVHYTNDAANGNQFYPSEIAYTGNTAAGVAPPNRVFFFYETRPDVVQHYQAGSNTRTTVRLTNAKTYANGTLVSDFRLAYSLSNATGRSRVSSITACDGVGSCLPATTFAWQDLPAGGLFTSQYSEHINNFGQPPNAGWSIVNGDFNGDGKADYALLGNGNRYVNLSSGDGYFAVVYSAHAANFGQPPHTNWSIVSGDFNGDGKADYALLGNSDRYVNLSNGDGHFSQIYNVHGANFGQPITNWSIASGDFNGDGRSDYALLGNSDRYVNLSNGDGTFTVHYSVHGANFGQPPHANRSIVEGDFNGDGKSDYALVGNGDRHVNLSNGDGTFTVQYSTFNENGSPPGAAWSVINGDFNGDGKTDYAMLGSGSRFAYLSNGDGNFTAQYSVHGANFGQPPHTARSVITGDFNGDGRADYALIGNGDRFVNLSNGDGNFTVQYSAFEANFGYPPHASWSVITGDFNGDGLSDHAMIGSNNRFVYVSNGPVPDLLTSATSGLGATTTITYVPATNTSVVNKGNGTAYPWFELTAPTYVVSRVDAPNGIGGTYSWTYTYSGGRIDSSGRGFLGFAETSVKDLQTDIVETTTYFQGFPYIGLVGTKKKTRYSLTLNEAANSYYFINAAGAASMSSPAVTSAPYRVLMSQSIAQSADLDGTAMPTVTTNYQYDAFGNPTQVATSTSDGFSRTTANTYTNDTALWLLGRLTRATVTSVAP